MMKEIWSRRDGFVYFEILLVIGLMALFFSYGGISISKIYHRQQLHTEAKKMVLRIRALQQETMEQYEGEGKTGKAIWVVDTEHMIKQNNRLSQIVSFSDHIRNSHGTTVIYFHKNGLPAGDKTLSLTAGDGAHVAIIYIAVQTGRIRMEVIKVAGT